MSSPRDQAAQAERRAALPPGHGERFAGYGVMGLTFASGHVLGLRRFTASSIGPAYTSVWHRDPDGRWEFFQDQPDDQACSRYFGAALAGTRRARIGLDWPGPAALRVAIAEAGFSWDLTLQASAASRALNAVGTAVPDRAWRWPALLAVMGPAAGQALRAGRVALAGQAPNGQAFVVSPQRIWLIARSSARLGGADFGPPGPLSEQARLGGFWIPQRGLFALGRAYFTA